MKIGTVTDTLLKGVHGLISVIPKFRERISVKRCTEYLHIKLLNGKQNTRCERSKEFDVEPGGT